MKKLLLILSLYIVNWQFSIAQSVGIGTTTPDASAKVEVSSTNKGMLVPRMSSLLRKAIASPATGLLVYDVTTNSFWFHNATQWVELVDSTNTIWTKAGSSVYVNNGENVGIGTSNPEVRLHIKNGTDISASSGGFLQLGDSTIPNLAFDNNEIQARNNGASSNLFLQNNGGNVAVGNVTPMSKLDINGQLTMRGGSPGADKVLTSDANGTATWRNAARGTGFFVSRSALQTIPSGGVVSALNFTNIIYNDGTNYNAANDYYVCPTAGFYHFDVNALFDVTNAFAGNGYFELRLYVNGTLYWGNAYNVTNVTYSTGYAYGLNLNLAANDHVKVFVDQVTGAPQSVRGYFTGYRLY